MKESFNRSAGQDAVRWALLVALATAALWLAVFELPGRSAYVDGGVLFACYLCLGGWLLVAAGAWVRGSLRGIGWPVLLLSPLVLALFVQGARASAGALADFRAIPYFAIGILLWARLGARETRPSAKTSDASLFWAAGLLMVGLGLAAVVVLLRDLCLNFLRWPDDRTSVSMLLMGRDGGGATDISGAPFTQWAWFGCVALWAALIVAVAALRDSIGERRLPAALFLVAILGKSALEGLASQGLGIIPVKIASVNTSYFTYAATVHNPMAFLAGFNALMAAAGPHVNVHPPMAVLIYWLLRHLLFSNPVAVAAAVMAFSASAVWPLYRLGRAMGGTELGFAVAALFATSPLNLILGNAGIDSMVFTMVAWSVWSLWQAIYGGGWHWASIAGLWLGLAAMNSFGSLAALVFLGTWGLLLLWRQGGGPVIFLHRNLELWAGFSVGLLAMPVLVWALSKGRFDYLSAVQTAKFVHTGMNQFRSYELWSWANVVLYTAFAGVGVVALWAVRVVGGLFNADTSDTFSLVSAPMLLVLVLQAYGRGEVQREYLFGAVFLIPAAAAALPRKADGRLRAPALAVALGLNALCAVALQMCVLDYW